MPLVANSGTLVQMHLFGLRGHQHPHEVARLLEAFDSLDLDAVEILVEHVAHGTADQVFFLIDDRGGIGLQGRLTDHFPQAQQIFIVTLDLGLGAFGTGGADDQPHALGHMQGGRGGLQAFPVGDLGDLARNAAALAGVGHQHAVAAGQRQPGGQGRALAAALVLDDLHQHDLAAFDDVLDLVAAHQAALEPLFLGHAAFGLVIALAGVLVVVVVFRMRFGHDGFAIGDGDLVVIRVDFAEGEEAVAVAAIFHERSLQAGLYANDLGEIDVAAKLALRAGFKVEFLDLTALDDGDAGFFRVRRIDQHGL